LWFLYISLPTIVAVFVMNKYLHTLDENFEAAEKFEQGMIYLGNNIYKDEAKSGGGHQEKKNVPHKQIIPAPKRK